MGLLSRNFCFPAEASNIMIEFGSIVMTYMVNEAVSLLIVSYCMCLILGLLTVRLFAFWIGFGIEIQVRFTYQLCCRAYERAHYAWISPVVHVLGNVMLYHILHHRVNISYALVGMLPFRHSNSRVSCMVC